MFHFADIPADMPYVAATIDSYVIGRKGTAAVLLVDGKSITAPISDMSVPVGTEVRLLLVTSGDDASADRTPA
jgi:hypothetical protein